MFSLTALAMLLPAALYPWRFGTERDSRLWAALLLAALGPSLWVGGEALQGWHTGLASALWVTMAATLLLFLPLARFSRWGSRLTPLLLPYLVLVGVVAIIARDAPQPLLREDAPRLWIIAHISVSVLTYALVTLAAVAALAALLQERALKRKRPNTLTRILPPMAESETLQVRLLAAAEAVLGGGLVTGMAVLHSERGILLRLDHKTLLSMASFVVIGILLLAHHRTGVRGRQAGRLVLFAYLLLTLAYPGVKFVTGIIRG